MATRGVLTLAFGAPKYVEMAKALARSLIFHSPETPRAIVTDSRDPELKALYTTIVQHRPSIGSNVRQKMYLDEYSPFDETLFIDSDCLAIGDLQVFWDAFQDKYFAAQGLQTLHAGDADPFLDVDFLLRHYSLAGIPKFNGGIYYFRKGPEAERLFATARSLLRDATELRFSQFKHDGPADEALYATAMAIHGLHPIDLGQRGMWSPGELQGAITINVAKGICSFVKRVGPERIPRLVHPDIVHFFSDFSDSLVYRRECLRIKKVVPELDSPDTLALTDELKLLAMTLPLKWNKLYRAVARRTKERRMGRMFRPSSVKAP